MLPPVSLPPGWRAQPWIAGFAPADLLELFREAEATGGLPGALLVRLLAERFPGVYGFG